MSKLRYKIYNFAVTLLGNDVFMLLLLLSLALAASLISFLNGFTIAYGDAESHLNIAKRVIASPTPGFSQLGGIWLPLPHLLMTPFVAIDFLWRTGLAGSIISGAAYIVGSIFIYKTTFLVTKNTIASFVGMLIFALNPNILYMQTTPMSELPLICFFILSVYYFTRFMYNTEDFVSLIFAAFFGFAASLSRYDGWFLIGVQGLILGVMFLIRHGERKKWIGYTTLFSTLALFGICLWLLWDFLILGDPFYFSNSPFSASSQQQGWLARGELPAYRNLSSSFIYYSFTSAVNIGLIASILSLIGLALFLITRGARKIYLPLLLVTPFVFYVLTLYIGQSVIFIPGLTPESFEWDLFNVRYGLMMVPAAAVFIGFLYYKTPLLFKFLLIALFSFQVLSFATGREPIITLEDGVYGLSNAKLADVQGWLDENYDDGYVLLDDFARTISIIRSPIPLENVVYVGSKPYWEESLETPEKHNKWIIMQRNDAIWKVFNDIPEKRGHLYKYYERAYTSPEILVFRRMK